MCHIAKEGKIAIASPVKELIADDLFQKERKYFLNLLPQDEYLLKLLFSKLEENWQEADFDMTEYCNATAMSGSQLYRKTIALTGLPPNFAFKGFQAAQSKRADEKTVLQYCTDNFRFRFYQRILFHQMF